MYKLSLCFLWESFINEMEKRRYQQPEKCYGNLQVGNTKEVKTQHPSGSMRQDGQATRLCPPTGDSTAKRNRKKTTTTNTQQCTTNNITGPLPTKTNKTYFIRQNRAEKRHRNTCKYLSFDAAAAVCGKSNMGTRSPR